VMANSASPRIEGTLPPGPLSTRPELGPGTEYPQSPPSQG
jgi:hypothetical protein